MTEILQTSGQASLMSSNQLAANLPPLKIWQVDDDDCYRGLMGQLLAREPGLQIERDFRSAEELLAALAAGVSPDVILLDVQMSGLSGVDALPFIRRAAPHARVLILTTFHDASVEKRARRGGAADYLLKRSSFGELLAAIRRQDLKVTLLLNEF